MKRQDLLIDAIPSVLWGDGPDELFIAVHGDQSHKADDVIAILAEEAAAGGGRVLSFDLPEHGDRKRAPELCDPQTCIRDLKAIMRYARGLSGAVGLFAVSMGAYFSLLAYEDEPLERALFLSPVVDMKRVIENMMAWFGVSEERLRFERTIPTPIGKTLSWDYYRYVGSHPVDRWGAQTSILYGSDDGVSEFEAVSAFAARFNGDLTVMENGEHYFHTGEQLAFFRDWLKAKRV